MKTKQARRRGRRQSNNGISQQNVAIIATGDLTKFGNELSWPLEIPKMATRSYLKMPTFTISHRASGKAKTLAYRKFECRGMSASEKNKQTKN